ncbi:hypothetical protein FYK55_14275 [Roseiconus nitratireducens]|uniref:LPP20 lipoprotein n=1 Tax=Roseiconus nitratireducens TaxID=2605748 RepID=A0A5M6D5R9_9BACT|nr:hypothetical protein [Roseiconus nitratireducens]KAA5542693.1 hypothetical protein FYK55_14275 [Roseiconus nitratireducens]
MNAKRISVFVLVLVTAISRCSAWQEPAKQESTTANHFLESLKRSRQAHLRITETINKGDNPTKLDPDKLVLRAYDKAIASAEKIIAAGGTYGQKEVTADQERINDVSQRVRENYVNAAKTQVADARREATETYERAVAEAMKKRAATLGDSEATYQRSVAQSNLTLRLKRNAGKLGIVVWNLPARAKLHDRSTVAVKIELLQQGRVVWTNQLARLNRRGDNSAFRLPNVLFDKVRIETTRWAGSGSGLAEVEVYAGTENLALGRPCEVSSIETLPTHLDDRDALTDGVTQPTEAGEGYWIPEEKTKATVTIDLLGAANQEIIDAAKARAAEAQAAKIRAAIPTR